jgi:hypothetical protein
MNKNRWIINDNLYTEFQIYEKESKLLDGYKKKLKDLENKKKILDISLYNNNEYRIKFRCVVGTIYNN